MAKLFPLVACLTLALVCGAAAAADDAPPAEPSESSAPEAKPEKPGPSDPEPADPAPAEPSSEESSPPVKAAAPETPAEPAAKEPDDEKPADDAQKFDLKYKFAPDEVLRTEVVQRATVQTTIQGTSQTAETQSRSVKTWQVSSVADDGTVTFVHSVESIDMRQKIQGRKEVHYNSATDREVPPGYEDAARAVGVPLTIVTMDNRGKILKRQEKRSNPASVSTQMTMPLPDHPITVGESWSSPLEIDVTHKDGRVQKIQTRQKFTLEKVEHAVATINVDSQVLTPIRDPEIEAQLIQRLSTGTVRFDVAAGRVLSQQLDLDRHVIGFNGAGSSMHYVTRFTERLLKDESTATARPKAAPPAAPRRRQSQDHEAPLGGRNSLGQDGHDALADAGYHERGRLAALQIEHSANFGRIDVDAALLDLQAADVPSGDQSLQLARPIRHDLSDFERGHRAVDDPRVGSQVNRARGDRRQTVFGGQHAGQIGRQHAGIGLVEIAADRGRHRARLAG